MPIQGPITPLLAQQTVRLIENLLRDDAVNFLCLWIESPGGSLADSVTLANALADLDPGRVRTVAYVATEAAGDAALIAMACDQVVDRSATPRWAERGWNRLPSTNWTRSARSSAIIWPRARRAVGRWWRRWSTRACRSFATRTPAPAWSNTFRPEEAESQPDADQWVKGEEIHKTREAAAAVGTAGGRVGIGPARRGRLQRIQAALQPGRGNGGRPHGLGRRVDRCPGHAGRGLLLLFVGIAALYAELHAPGIGVGGFIAGLCFLLFFWSKYLDGTAGWLEVLLFGAGIVCVLLEIFVLPGTAIFGLGGGLLIIASLILASQTFVLPHNEYQFRQLRDTLLGLSAVGVGVVIAALVMRRFLPRTALFGHMVLEPPSSSEMEHIANRESLVDFSHLMGSTGVTVTPLAPAGKARFGSELVACSLARRIRRPRRRRHGDRDPRQPDRRPPYRLTTCRLDCSRRLGRLAPVSLGVPRRRLVPIAFDAPVCL